MASNVDGYFSFGDIAQTYISLENRLFAIADWFAQCPSVGAEYLRIAATRLDDYQGNCQCMPLCKTT